MRCCGEHSQFDISVLWDEERTVHRGSASWKIQSKNKCWSVNAWQIGFYHHADLHHSLFITFERNSSAQKRKKENAVIYSPSCHLKHLAS